MVSINLIPRVRFEAKQRRRRVRAWLGIIIGYAVVVAIGLIAVRLVTAIDSGGMLRQLNALAKSIRESDSREKSLRAKLVKTMNRHEANQVITGHPDWSLLIALVADKVGESVVLRSINIQPDPRATGGVATASSGTLVVASFEESSEYVVQLAGAAKTQPDVMQLALQLEQLGLFDKVRLLDSRREPFLDSEVIAFQIECELGSGTGAIQ